MKKLILSLILSVSLVGMAFSENIFSHRFFEVKLDVPVAVSNNLVGLTDIFQKTVVIDLPGIADSLKLADAASVRADAAPTLSINLDIPNGPIFGIQIGAEADVSVGLSKDIFEFIGHGNASMGNSFTQKTTNTYADVFGTAALTGGWNGKKTRVAVKGTAFWALAHVDASETYVKVYNNESNNEFGVEAKLDAKVYAPFDFMHGMDDIEAIISQAGNGIGFDVSADIQRDVFRFLTMGVQTRVPIMPSKLNMCASAEKSFDYSVCFDDLLKGEEQNSQGESTGTGSSSGSEQQEGEDSILSEFTQLAKPYEIHRPLKLGVSADFHPFGTLLTTSGYIGVGIRHPFSKDNTTDFYIDYSVAGRLSLWNILSFELCHSYYDEVFKNELAVQLNIRLVEVDAGVSLQSTNLAKSFTGAGFGAFVTVAIGF